MFTFVRDHLGSVRAVVDFGGKTVCEESDYYTYGGKIPGCSATQLFDSRWGYSGKEGQSTIAGLPYLDYGARLYDTRTCRWLSPDPLAEKYRSTTPYGFCVGNPVNFVDPDGKRTFVRDNQDGTYTVCGGERDNNRKIYLVDENNEYILKDGKKVSIGKSMTKASFYDDNSENGFANAVIDMNNQSGDKFIREMTTNLIPLGDYMEHAKNGELFDYKVTNGQKGVTRNDIYRGSPVSIGNKTVIASARDIGNYVAGYYAGANGFTWGMSRIALDLYEGGVECSQTQSAQFLGWFIGFGLDKTVKGSNFIISVPSLYDFCETWVKKH